MSVDVPGKGSEKGLLRSLAVLGHDDTRWTEASQHRSPISPTMHVDPAPRSLYPLYRAWDRRCRQHAETFPVPIAAADTREAPRVTGL